MLVNTVLGPNSLTKKFALKRKGLNEGLRMLRKCLFN